MTETPLQSLRVDTESQPCVAGDDGEGSEVPEAAGDSPGPGVASISTLSPVASQSELALADIIGGSRTAATISVAAPMSLVDVTSVIVNKMSQDTDTVVHHSGMSGM